MLTEIDYGILTTEYVRTCRYQPRTLRAVAGPGRINVGRRADKGWAVKRALRSSLMCDAE